MLFTDIEGSTHLLQQVGERYPAVLATCRYLLRAMVRQWGGYEVDTRGDGFFAAFARATDAVSAAVAAQRAFASHAWSEAVAVRVRMGLHTGEPQRTAEGYVGLDVHHAARIMSVGYGGQVLFSQTTRALVEHDLPEGVSLRDLGEHQLKDLQQKSHLSQLVIEGLPADFPPLLTLDTHPHNLPIQPTPFIGREREIVAVQQLLEREDVRLLTLTGPGGSGKTRLGLQVAAELSDHFADGVFFVNLAPTSVPDLVVPTIAQTLGLKESSTRLMLEQLQAFLQEKHLLLVLDNFEQVVAAAPSLSDLLAACPHLTLLVTSRQVLRLAAEHEFAVPPLSLPDLTHLPDLVTLSQYEAVALFIQRAKAAGSEFEVTNATARAVAEICAHLDGLPLAIELAAARIKLLSPQALLARMGQRLAVLTGGVRDAPVRQQTLRNTIDWSYQLLDAEEQRLFRRLSVFVGGCTLEAVQAVCLPDAAGASSAQVDEEAPVLEQLAQLLDKSLVQAQQGRSGEPRFSMLETIREYAIEQLQESREEVAVQARHAHYFLRLAEEAWPHFFRPTERDSWLERLEPEEANLRVALAWCEARQDRVKTGLRLAGALAPYWYYRGSLHEGRTWLQAMLAHSASWDRSAAQGQALYGVGMLAFFEEDFVAAAPRLEESISIAREVGDKRLTAYTTSMLGMVRVSQGDIEAARPLFAESQSLVKELGDAWGEALALFTLGIVAYFSGDLATARTQLEESVRLFQAQGDVLYASTVLSALQGMLSTRGDQELAGSLSQPSLPLMQQTHNRGTLGLNLINTGDLFH